MSSEEKDSSNTSPLLLETLPPHSIDHAISHDDNDFDNDVYYADVP